MPIRLKSANDSNTVAAAGTAAGGMSLPKLSRRSFIAALALAGCTRLNRLPQQRTPAETRWALLSDTHTCRDPHWTVRGDNMADNLRRTVQDVRRLRPDHVLFNGDMAFARGHPDDYAAFFELTAPLWKSAGSSMHFTLGNHDHREQFLAAHTSTATTAVDHKKVYSFNDGCAEWILLDSLETVNAVRGSLGRAQLAWLAGRLDAERDTPAIICVHHNPHELIGLRDARRFLDVVVSSRRAKLVLHGHTHRYGAWEKEGLHFVNLPALGYRFDPEAPLGWLSARVSANGARVQFTPVGATEAIRALYLPWRTDG